MKSFASISALAFASMVVAQSAHDGMLPLTTSSLTNAAGSVTGQETFYATAISTQTLSDGSLNTIYSDLSGIVTPTTSVSMTTAVSQASTSVSGSLVSVTTTGSSTTATGVVVVLSGTGSTTESGSATSSKSTATTKVSTSTSASSTANASGSAGDRVVVGGLGIMGVFAAAGLIVL